MADDADWRSSLTASERYDNIQKLTKAAAAAGLNQSAFSVENDAYTKATSREDYDAACNLTTGAPELPSPSPASPPETEDEPSSPGTTIGHHQNCHYIASGVTAAVYRSQARALKVIVETHNIEPHNPHREAKILASLRATAAPHIIPLLETFHDQNQRFVLAFPYMPLTLADLLATHQPNPLPTPLIRTIFTALFRALAHLHAHSIIHRDIKPTALLLASPSPHHPQQIHLADFGTAYHPTLSPAAGEPPTQKVLDIGTGPYRAPETLFGDRAYGPGVDLWAAGATLAECLLGGRRTLFESRAAHEDGNQLGLVLSMFKTLGTPTPATWPEARGFRTPPFEMYRVFEGRVEREGWEGVLGGADAADGVGGEGGWRGLVAGFVRFESGWRVTAEEALEFPCMKAGGVGG